MSPSPDDGRVREVVLTELGETLYHLLAERVACVILAAAEMLQEFGAVPADAKEQAKMYMRNYALRIRKSKD